MRLCGQDKNVGGKLLAYLVSLSDWPGHWQRQFEKLKSVRESLIALRSPADSDKKTPYHHPLNLTLECPIQKIKTIPGGIIYAIGSLNIAYIDDVVTTSRNISALVCAFDEFARGVRDLGLRINQKKTKYMKNSKPSRELVVGAIFLLWEHTPFLPLHHLRIWEEL